MIELVNIWRQGGRQTLGQMFVIFFTSETGRVVDVCPIHPSWTKGLLIESKILVTSFPSSLDKMAVSDRPICSRSILSVRVELVPN